jgi:hypothetical protein
MHKHIYVKYLLSYQILVKPYFSHQIFKKSSDIKFHENLSDGGRGVSCGRTAIRKLAVAYRNAVKVTKN